MIEMSSKLYVKLKEKVPLKQGGLLCDYALSNSNPPFLPLMEI